MIQRIQSVYLLLVSMLMSITAMSPLIALEDIKGQLIEFKSLGLYSKEILATPTWGVITFAVMSALFAFSSIFLFKRRKLQLKLGIVNIILMIFFYGTFATYFYVIQRESGFIFDKFEYGLVLPIVALIINILALIRIKADEKLVRSLDRIR